MKNNLRVPRLLAPALLVAGCLMIPASARTGDSPEITKLLADVKAEAIELKHDSADMESFTKSKTNWETFAGKASLIREHINATGKLLAILKESEEAGSPWQQAAIKRIEPLLRELAANTETTINYLNDNRAKIHFPEFTDYVKANCELATDLEALIRDFMNYGEAKDKYQGLRDKLEISRH